MFYPIQKAFQFATSVSMECSRFIAHRYRAKIYYSHPCPSATVSVIFVRFFGFFGMAATLLTRGDQAKLAKSALAPFQYFYGVNMPKLSGQARKGGLLDFFIIHDFCAVTLRFDGAGSDMFLGIIKH